MTDDQREQFKSEIVALVEAKVEERNGGKAMRVIQFLTSTLLACVTAVIIPFGVWTVQQIHKLDITDKELQSRQSVQQAWMDQGPRFTAKDAENLKLTVMGDVSEKLSREVTRFSEKLDRVADSFTDTKMQVSEVRREVSELKSMMSKKAQ